MREDRQRLDKWLWFARFAKTRTLAAKLVADGYVRVNGGRAGNAAKPLCVGDVGRVAAAPPPAVGGVGAPGTRRGRAWEARLLYADLGRDDGAFATGPDRV